MKFDYRNFRVDNALNIWSYISKAPVFTDHRIYGIILHMVFDSQEPRNDCLKVPHNNLIKKESSCLIWAIITNDQIDLVQCLAYREKERNTSHPKISSWYQTM